MTDSEYFDKFWSESFRSLLVRALLFGSILAAIFFFGAFRWDKNILIAPVSFLIGFSIIFLPEFFLFFRPNLLIFRKNTKLMTPFRNEILNVGKADMIRKGGFARVVKAKTNLNN